MADSYGGFSTWDGRSVFVTPQGKEIASAMPGAPGGTQSFTTPQVQGVTTQTPSAPAAPDKMSGFNMGNYPGWDEAAARANFLATGGTQASSSGPSPEDILNQGYEQAFKSLDEQWGGLDTQATNQNQIADNTFNQQSNTLQNSYNQNLGDLQSGQTKALTDLGDTMRQQWQQGNTLLGTKGASDSSAANQYSYALTKLGSKQRGDISTEYARMQSNLKSTYDTNVQNLSTQLSNQKLSIANWLAESQNQIRGLRADLQQEKSQQIYNYALSQLQTLQQQATQQKSMLDQWVMNRANTLQEAISGMNTSSANMPTFQGLNGTPSGSTGTNYNLFGYGTSTEDKNKLF